MKLFIYTYIVRPLMFVTGATLILLVIYDDKWAKVAQLKYAGLLLAATVAIALFAFFGVRFVMKRAPNMRTHGYGVVRYPSIALAGVMLVGNLLLQRNHFGYATGHWLTIGLEVLAVYAGTSLVVLASIQPHQLPHERLERLRAYRYK